jgi:hypothetical protein
LDWAHRWFNPEGDRSGVEVGERLADLLLDGLVRA